MLADTVIRPSRTTLRHSTTTTPAWQIVLMEIMPIWILFKPCMCSMILKILRTLITLNNKTWHNLCDTTHQYSVTNTSVSGDLARFEDRLGEKSYLLYFHNMITATGAENLESLMKAELSVRCLCGIFSTWNSADNMR